MEYDIIISGAGLGGLTAGAKLSKSGKKVLVLEQHDRPGGCATTFKRKDFTMEVGLHEMDGLHRADPKSRIFSDLGISDRVEFLELPEFYRFYNERHSIVIPHDPQEAKEILYSGFPKEKEGIDSYFEHVLNSRRILKESAGQKDKSIGDFLDSIINDEDLKLTLLGNLGYYHDDPYTLSYYYYISAQNAYYNGRANFIKGGSQKLSDALSSIIKENGGEVLLNSRVTAIKFKSDKAVGVEWQSKNSGQENYAGGKEIIVSSSLPDLAENLLPEGQGQKLNANIKLNKTGASLLTVYYGFSKALKDLGNPNYSIFVYDPSVKSQRDILPNNHSDFNTRSFTLVDYSQVDSDLAPAGKSVGAVCCIDYTSDWENLSREEYKNRKQEVADLITGRCEKIIPGFRDAVEHCEVGTATTVRRYTLNRDGAVYGFAQNPGKSNDYLSSLPEGIHIASAWGKFGGGFSGAIISGYMTANELLRKA